MKFKFLTIAFCLIGTTVTAQLSDQELSEKPIYNLSFNDQHSDMAAVKPEEVYRLNIDLSKEDVKTLTKYKNLEELHIIHSNHGFPHEIIELKNLKHLTIFCGEFEKMPDDMGKMVHLQSLTIHNVGLTHFPVHVVDLPNLTSLDISGNHIDEIPGSISSLTKLKKLVLGSLHKNCSGEESFRGNPINTLPAGLKDLENLEYLDLTGCPISTLPSFIAEMKSLKTLIIAETEIDELPGALMGKIENNHLTLGYDKKNNKFTKDFAKQMKKLAESNTEKQGKYTITYVNGKAS